jgi:hypothetical protein
MPSSATTVLRLEKPATGEKSGTWGTIANLNYDMLEAAIAGTVTISTTSGTVVLTNVDYTNDQAKKAILYCNGALVGNLILEIPNASKTYWVVNNTSGSYTVTVKTNAGSAKTVTQGAAASLYCDGSNTVLFVSPEVVIGTGAPNTAGGAAASSVSVSATGNLSSTNAQAALAELQGDIDTINTALGNKQASDTDLSAIAALSNTKGNLIIGGNAAAWTALSVGTDGLVLRAKSGAATGAAWGAGLPATTVSVFYQAAAPVGWTIGNNTYDNRAIVINNTSGGGSAGGSVNFTTAFASKTPTGTVGGTALTEANLPAHDHFAVSTQSGGSSINGAADYYLNYLYNGGADTQSYLLKGQNSSAPTTGLTSETGGGTTHTHTFTGDAIDLAVKYLTMIAASADA